MPTFSELATGARLATTTKDNTDDTDETDPTDRSTTLLDSARPPSALQPPKLLLLRSERVGARSSAPTRDSPSNRFHPYHPHPLRRCSQPYGHCAMRPSGGPAGTARPWGRQRDRDPLSRQCVLACRPDPRRSVMEAPWNRSGSHPTRTASSRAFSSSPRSSAPPSSSRSRSRSSARCSTT
jgi:hypothetical protein